MATKSINPTLLVALGILGTLGTFGYSQLAAIGEPSANVGVIEGIVDSDLIGSNPAVVYLKDVPGEFPPPAESDSLNIQKITFAPKVCPILVGTSVICPNKDTITHNIFSPRRSAKPFNFGQYPPGSSKKVLFSKPGVVPFLCNIHAEMSAFVVVLPNPFFARTEKDGKYRIKNVPAGKYKLTFWHENLRPKTVDVTVAHGGSVEVNFNNLVRGKYSIDLLK